MAAGSTGSGKSIVTIGILHILCCLVPGLKFAIIRKSEKNLKQTTIPSYKKIKKMSKSEGDSIVVDMTARYKNGSEILFIWADISKDPDLDNIKGLELTGALIEEANQIDRRYFDLLKTRIGRWNNSLCPQFIMLNMNPTAGWCKELFYDNWVDGTLPEKYYFEEFDECDIDDLIKSGDLEKEFIEGLEDLPDEEKGRFLHNRWDYSDVPNQLVRYEWYKNAVREEYFIKRNDRGMIALDPSDQGVDSTVLGRMHGNHIGWWEEYPKQDPGESGIIAMNRAHELGISQKDTIVDSVGIGAGSVVAMRLNKFYPNCWVSGNRPYNEDGFLKFGNKRAEGHWLFREGLRNEEITLHHNIKLQRESTKCTYEVTDKIIKIAGKEILKKPQYIGWSPGHLDNCAMLAQRYFTSVENIGQKVMAGQVNEILKRNASSVNRDAMLRGRRKSVIGVFT